MCQNILCQNLVPNPSFEINTGCPTSISQINLAIPWSSPNTATPDYIHTCGTALWVTAPKPFGGYQQPRTGNAYAHIICYADKGPVDYREYLQIQLSTPLTAGIIYEVKFYVSLNNLSQFAINNLGAYLSSTPLSTPNNLVINVIPQIIEPNIISDTVNWVPISGYYLATGGEEYLTIGNFFDDASLIYSINTGVRNLISNTAYLIDDVSVLPVSVLPVTLNYFNAEFETDNLVKLNWSTATEINNAYYTIQKSINGKDFKTIGTVKGNGNNNKQTQYFFTDTIFYYGSIYYKLLQTDFNGKTTELGITTLYKDFVSDIKLYPNPTVNELNISLPEIYSNKLIYYCIKDITGNVILDNHIYMPKNNLLKISVNALNNGIYTIEIILEDTVYSFNFFKTS
jgi:hypothetical protein